MLLEYFYVYTILVSAQRVIEAKTPYHPSNSIFQKKNLNISTSLF